MDETGVKISAIDNFSATYGKFIDANTQAASNVDKLTGGLMQMGAAVAGIGIIAKGIEFLKDSLNEAAQDETNVMRLGIAIKNAGDAYGASATQIESFALQLEKATIYGHDETIPAMQKLAVAGLDFAASQRVLKAAMDLSSGSGMGLQQAITMLTAAYEGHARGFFRLGIAAKDFVGIMKEVEQKYGGAAQAELDTYNGKLKQLDNVWKEQKETLGGFWIPTMKIALELLGGWPALIDRIIGSGTQMATGQRLQAAQYVNDLVVVRAHLIVMGNEIDINGKKSVVTTQMALAGLTAQQLAIATATGNSTAKIDALLKKAKDNLHEINSIFNGPPADIKEKSKGPDSNERELEKRRMLSEQADRFMVQSREAADKKMTDADKMNSKEARDFTDREIETYARAKDDKIALAQAEYDKRMDLAKGLTLSNQQQNMLELAEKQKLYQAEFKAFTDTAKAIAQGYRDLGNATTAGIIDSAIKMVETFQTLINSINAMLEASGPVGFFLGLLGVVSSVVSMSASIKQLNDLKAGITGYATGTDYVPKTGLYQLHQGEAVIPAEQNRSGSTAGSSAPATNIVFNISGMPLQTTKELAVQIGKELQNAVRGCGATPFTSPLGV